MALMALAAVLSAAPITRWEELGATGQRITLAVAGVMLLLLATLIWRQLRKRRSPPQDPEKLHRWFREYEYDWATGTAVNVTSMQRGDNFLVARTLTGTDSQPLAASWTDV